jgi:TonB-dependent receptor
LPFEQWHGREGFLKVGVFENQVERRFRQETYQNSRLPTEGAASFQAPFNRFFSRAYPRLVARGDAPTIKPVRTDVNYDGTLDVQAWSWMADLPLTSWLKTVGGMRFESTQISIRSDLEREADIIKPDGTVATPFNRDGSRRTDPDTGLPFGDSAFQQDDVFPSVALVLDPLEDVTVRASYAETLARQTFRELAPVRQREFLGGSSFVGNPSLQAASVENYDLRIDYRPAEGALLSASVFHKDIVDPIEVVQRFPEDGSSGFDTPINFPKGELRGLELELRGDLGKLSERLRGLSAGFNATFLESNVQLPTSQKQLLSKPIEERDLVNAPERLLNFNLRYTIEETGTELGLFYTLTGESLVAGATQNDGRFVPPRVKREFDRLDFTLKQPLGEHLELSFSAENLTNPDIQQAYKSRFTETRVASSFSEGIDWSVNLSASFEF